MKRPDIFLNHILVEINYLSQKSKTLEYDKFIHDETLTRSFVRSLEVIGEATKNLPDDFKVKYPFIQWKQISGLRDVLIHHYFGIDFKSVWDIVKNKIPIIKQQIEQILSEIKETG